MIPDDAITRLADAPRLLVALDFDGTMSTLIDDPMQARMHPRARVAFDALRQAPGTTVALVSGRSLHDLRVIAEHEDDSDVLLAGSHGAERWTPDGASPEEPTLQERTVRDELRARAESIAASVPGAWIEPKTFGFAVPTRTVAPPLRGDLHARIDDLVATRAPGWRRRTGHDIVEYAFRDIGKDDAVAWLRQATDASAVLFAGDDITDEDALRALGTDDVGVRVGAGETAADVRVDDIPELAEMLVRLAQARGQARE
ncbi:trehalose-phosphatase [Microbacterium dextranolyticum]|uniref:Trehalose 6-phosphate phosphatase n=1 Tax=Microbacterium dextranolyticum TaxID=36806 RepID=A0A9W6HNC2_9MICO|nr:trehalose-phosphatase [Microbacterium dextranolyticum]MBM7463153.1 trehalose 6-phosphate phosphatase [Microbacterium dextranolyticum]GLJ95740.1 trehalose 6-phosphate phosphatase [Microbacterium dextranolyticum]